MATGVSVTGVAAPSGAAGRGSASPLQRGTASRPGVHIASCDGCIPPPRRSTRTGALRDPRPVGVRRCLTRRPSRAGNPVAARCPRAVRIAETADPRRMAVPRVARPGEALSRPYMVGRRIPGRVFGCDGRMPPPSGRGQTLPDPSACWGRQTPPRSVRCRGRVICAGTFAAVHMGALPGAAPVDCSRASFSPRALRPIATASPCRLLTASPLGEPRRLNG